MFKFSKLSVQLFSFFPFLYFSFLRLLNVAIDFSSKFRLFHWKNLFFSICQKICLIKFVDILSVIQASYRMLRNRSNAAELLGEKIITRKIQFCFVGFSFNVLNIRGYFLNKIWKLTSIFHFFLTSAILMLIFKKCCLRELFWIYKKYFKQGQRMWMVKQILHIYLFPSWNW